MRITSAHVISFKRFADLTIRNIPKSTRLVLLAGPNGSGKSSLFDAFLSWFRSMAGWVQLFALVLRSSRQYGNFRALPAIGDLLRQADSGNARWPPKDVLFSVSLSQRARVPAESLSRVAPITENLNLQRMIENDATVLTNYQRIASQAVEDVLVHEQRNTTKREYRDRIVGEIRQSMLALFPDLLFTDVGNPIDNGTFRFKKGEAVGFEYLNLSGGEKAAFDLLLDLIVKRRFYDDTVYCIDEPEMHLNARVQARLLDELMRLLPTSSQMWLATHSIGMMRKAKELAQAAPGTVTFLDFDKRDFDTPTILEPIAPTRAFWESALSVALDDLSSLVAPQELIVCEGNPTASVCGKNMALDAACYDTIFAVEKPDTKFLGSGSSGQVLADRLGFVAGISALVPGIAVKRLIDRDDHTPADVAAFKADGIRVLSRRNVESYIFDDEVLIKLCVESNKAGKTADILEAKKSAMAASAREVTRSTTLNRRGAKFITPRSGSSN